jgi:hypothetical protein
MLHIAGLIHDVQAIPARKRVYFILDACYSGSAISDMESMDAGGAEKLIDRSLSEAVEGGNGTAVLAASGKLAVAFAKQEDKLTLFTGALVRCLRDGIAHKFEFSTLSWLDIKDEIIRTTRDRLGPDAPIPKLTSFSDDAVDIIRVPFFENRAYKPRTGGDGAWASLDERTSEHIYFKGITEKSPAYVLEDFLTKFPTGTFTAPARAFLARQIEGFDEKELEGYLFENPRSFLKEKIDERLTALKWDQLRTGSDIGALERFIKKFPRSKFVDEAQRTVEFLRIKPPEANSLQEKLPHDPVEPIISPPPGKSTMPPLAAVEMASIPDIPAPAATKASEGATSGGLVGVNQVSDRLTWMQSVVKQRIVLLGLFVVGLLLAAIAFQNTLRSSLQAFQQELDAAGTDVTKLTGFIDRCRPSPSCTLEREARDRLANAQALERARELIQASYRELDAAGTDVAKLSSFIDRCKAAGCMLEQEARNRFASAQAADSRTKLAAADRILLDAAGTDVGAIRIFVDRCKMPACTLGAEASSRLAAAEARSRVAALEAERTRLAAAETERNRLAAAEAERNRLAAEAAERTRLAAEAERARLARIAALTTARPPVGFNTHVNYDISGGDMRVDNTIRIIRETAPATCQSNCQSLDGCVAYSFDKWNHSCYLKDTLGALVLDPHSDVNIRKDQQHPGYSNNPAGFCTYSKSALSGDGFPGFISTSAKSCEQSCAPSPACVAYSFRSADRLCWLFRSTTDRRSGVDNVTSGIRTQYSCR